MKRGLVFCGGGSKGAYQMGAWQALEELNEKFDIVTGTSIGCLNGAMFTQHDYQKCYELWDTINVNKIMNKGLTLDEKSIRTSLKKKQDLMPFLKQYIQDFGVDIGPFLDLMNEYISPETIKNSDIDFGIVTASFPGFKPVEIRAKDIKLDEIKKYILASASCFPIFPVCKIGDKKFVDGGYYDNLPINFALNMGATSIVAIDLNVDGTHKEFMNLPFVKYIKPSWSLGSFMFFEHSIICNNRTLGYNDTMKAYGKYFGFRYTFYNFPDNDKYRDFSIYIAKIVGKMKIAKIKTNVKPEKDGDIYYLLTKYTTRPLTDKEYFIRGAEIAAEFLNIDHLVIYEIDGFMQQILSLISQLEEDITILDGYKKLKTSLRQKDYLSRISDNILLKYLYLAIMNNEELDDSFLMNVIASKPNIFIIYSLIKTWSR